MVSAVGLDGRVRGVRDTQLLMLRAELFLGVRTMVTLFLARLLLRVDIGFVSVIVVVSSIVCFDLVWW